VIWLPDGSYGVELPPTKPITVHWHIDAPPVDVPAEYAAGEYGDGNERGPAVRGDQRTAHLRQVDAGRRPVSAHPRVTITADGSTRIPGVPDGIAADCRLLQMWLLGSRTFKFARTPAHSTVPSTPSDTADLDAADNPCC